MINISTKTGDRGETGLYRGERVSKSHPLIDLLGELDELQVLVGLAKFGKDGSERFGEILNRVEDDLYRMMSIVGYQGKVPEGMKDIVAGDVEWLEEEMEKYADEVGDLREFVRPGVNVRGARLHHARAVCRRVERKFVAWGGHEWGMKYLNRLSDLLFVYAYVVECKSVE